VGEGNNNLKKRILFVVISGPMKGQKYLVELDSPFLIGRGKSAVIDILYDPTVSRKHAIIYFNKNNFYIRDLNSTNGTYVNGNKIGSDTVIEDGTAIQTGKTVFMIKLSKNVKKEEKYKE